MKTAPLPSDLRIIANKFNLDNVSRLSGDASDRGYFRGHKNDKSFIVMFYPNANNKTCAELDNFLKNNRILNDQGIKVAKCYEVDKKYTCALLEDLGDLSFGACLRNKKETPIDLYTIATQILIKMRNIRETSSLPLYKQTHLYANRRQLIDYYMFYKSGKRPNKELVNDFHRVWNQIESTLPECPQGFVHGDYHLENIMLIKDRQGNRQGAVIDHQDAFYGPLPYDLVNLLEDARINVPVNIRNKMMQIYTKDMSEEEKEVFMAWYRVLAAQFHGRVIGLFIKFAAEQNKDSYLAHIPRLQKYIIESLKDPILAPLKTWFIKVGLDFYPITPLDGDRVRSVIK